MTGSLTIPIGAASATITVTPLDDSTVESNEMVLATVTAQAAYTVGSPSSATVTISSNDGTPHRASPSTSQQRMPTITKRARPITRVDQMGLNR